MRDRRAHPAPTTLSRYLDDDLAVRERVAVDEHVRDCGPCRRLMESLAQTIGGLRSLRTRESSPRAERIIAALALANRQYGARQISAFNAGWRERLRAGVRYCLQRSQLRLTVPTGLVVGTVLIFLNMGGMLLNGEIDVATGAACAMDYLLPFLGMNIILLTTANTARRR